MAGHSGRSFELFLKFRNLAAIDPPAPALVTHLTKQLQETTRFAHSKDRDGRRFFWRSVDPKIENRRAFRADDEVECRTL
jgi:hypothetical protein